MQIMILDTTDAVRCMATTEGETMRLLEDLHTEDLSTGEATYEFSVAGDHNDAQFITPENQVVFRDLDGYLQLMRIKTVETEHGNDDSVLKTATAVCAGYELNGEPQRPETWYGAAAAAMLSDILSGTRFSAGIVEPAGMKDGELKYCGKWEAVQYVRELFGLDIRVRCVLERGRVSQRLVDLVTRGNATGHTFRNGVDIRALTKTEDSFEIATAILPLGASDSEGGYVTIAGVAAVGKSVDADWIGDENARSRYGRLLADGTRAHITRVVEFSEVSTPADLLSVAKAKLADMVTPQVTLELDPLMLDALGMPWMSVRVGDTVGIVDARTGVAARERIMAIKRSYVDKSKSGV